MLVLAVLLAYPAGAADRAELRERRLLAAGAFADGILLLHATPTPQWAADGFRQDPAFYYFTGLENTLGALLAIDGRSRQTWLFLPTTSDDRRSLPPEIRPGAEAAARLGIEHVVDWKELEKFFGATAPRATLYYLKVESGFAELPANVTGARSAGEPLWVSAMAAKWPALRLREATDRVYGLMELQSPSELSSVRAAARTTVRAFAAGLESIQPDVPQRTVESAVEGGCWSAGAHGSSFWPWSMAGANGAFPRPLDSLTRYDHLNGAMKSGDLVRLDVGCEWEHYGGDLGRTIPVSGHYSEDQREVWNTFVEAYRAGVRLLRAGVTEDAVFAAWRAELLRHRASARSSLARRAIDLWSKRENVPFWQLHTTNLVAGGVSGPLRAGMTIDNEPIAAIDGQGYYLEDMFLITKEGAELLTPDVPYTAEEIEAAMKRKGR